MKWKLPEDRKKQYDIMLQSAQDLETKIGSSQYRIHKLLSMREDIDKGLKMWWEQVVKDLNLDSAKDYMITKDGEIQDVSKTEPSPTPSAVGTNAQELK